ncbi:MAG: FAD-binding oxidoreductase, partial [Chitinophagales bacterium]
MHFNKLKVASIEQLTPLSKKITFELPASISSNYSFKSGQYVSLELNIEDKKIRRSYSICSPCSQS